MPRTTELTGIEEILLRGLHARELLIQADLDRFHADRDAVLAAIAGRLGVDPAEMGVRYRIDPKNASVTDLGEEPHADPDQPAADRP